MALLSDILSCCRFECVRANKRAKAGKSWEKVGGKRPTFVSIQFSHWVVFSRRQARREEEIAYCTSSGAQNIFDLQLKHPVGHNSAKFLSASVACAREKVYRLEPCREKFAVKILRIFFFTNGLTPTQWTRAIEHESVVTVVSKPLTCCDCWARDLGDLIAVNLSELTLQLSSTDSEPSVTNRSRILPQHTSWSSLKVIYALCRAV